MAVTGFIDSEVLADTLSFKIDKDKYGEAIRICNPDEHGFDEPYYRGTCFEGKVRFWWD